MERKPIRNLDPILVDQIKAGEVIGAPSNVLKELLENALDAGATQIHVTIEGAGLDLIVIEDNGAGIPFAQMPLAFTRHATNKLSNLGDLTELQSFGFRGEALASIASISKITCLTFCPDLQEGGQLQIEGGKVIGHLQTAGRGEQGTTFRIENLFYNTPVRLKFLRSTSIEKKELWKVFCAYLLANPQCHFTWRFDDQDKLIFPSLPSFPNAKRHRRDKIFGKAEEDHRWVDLNFSYLEASLRGMISLTPVHRSKKQFLFINGRPIQDKLLTHTVKQAMRTLWQGDNGDFALFLELPLGSVDVNVHPEKSLVKFERPGLVHALLHGALATVRPATIQDPSGVPEVKPTAISFDGPVEKSLNGQNFSSAIIANSPQNAFQVQVLDRQTLLLMSSSPATSTQLLHLPTLIYSILQKICQESAGNDQSIVPLLVSEPFDFKYGQDHILNWAEKIGMEFDRLDPVTIALRSWPADLMGINSSSYCKIFLAALEKLKPKSEERFHKILAEVMTMDFIESEFLETLTSDLPERATYLHTLVPGELAKAFFSESFLAN